MKCVEVRGLVPLITLVSRVQAVPFSPQAVEKPALKSKRINMPVLRNITPPMGSTFKLLAKHVTNSFVIYLARRGQTS